MRLGLAWTVGLIVAFVAPGASIAGEPTSAAGGDAPAAPPAEGGEAPAGDGAAGDGATDPSAGGDDGLNVVVAPGARTLDPMAIPDVKCVEAPSRLCRMMTDVLQRDMLLSFFFKVLPPRSYLADPNTETLTETSWGDWANVGAQYLIKAEVKGPPPYTVEFRLYNVPQKKEVRVRGQSAKESKERDLRRATHRFANGVLEALTGTPGVYDTRIAYTYKAGAGVKSIGIMDMDGANRSGLVTNGSINMLPSWGMGGVLYTSFKDGKPDIFFGKRKLSKDEGHYRKVAVSPTGQIVASISYGGQSDLWLLGKDGSRIRNLTNTAADEVSPTFSPDGSKLAFVSSAPGSPQIYMMPSSGGSQTRLTWAGEYNYAPDWGPNGLIAFTGMEEGISDIFTVTEGGEIQRLTQNQGSNKYPSWSRDGRYIGFSSTRPAGSGIWLMSADGRYQYRVLKGGGITHVAWEK